VNRAIEWFAGNHVAANLLMFAIILAGLVSVPYIKQSVWPDFEINYVSATVVYPGASPEDVEKAVTVRLEQEIEGVEGIVEIKASANEGATNIRIELEEDVDLGRALDEAPDERTATALVDALGVLLEEHASEEPVPALLRALRAGRGSEGRLLAALAASGSGEAAMPIFSRLEDADEDTRAAALDATERYLARRPRDGRVADPLLHLLARARRSPGSTR